LSVNPFGHIDLRVKDAGKAAAFYSKLLPELGFTRIFHGGGWRVFATEGELPQAAYFALTEDPGHLLRCLLYGPERKSPRSVPPLELTDVRTTDLVTG